MEMCGEKASMDTIANMEAGTMSLCFLSISLIWTE